jgi:hypothetical protein
VNGYTFEKQQTVFRWWKKQYVLKLIQKMKVFLQWRHLLKNSKVFVCIVFCSFILHGFISRPLAYAEASLGEAIDCTDVSVDYSEDSTLTREERLRLMDKAFFESLNKFELCQAAKEKAKAAGSGGADGGGGADNGAGGDGAESSSGDSAGDMTGGPAGESVPSSTMSGTEVAKKDPSGEDIQAQESGSMQGSQDIDEAGSKTGGNVALATGKLPEDIPPAKNDDALAAQIRYAAENEQDPIKSAQLWNEYRKYKGLAIKK